ncbi:hypothetical protein UMZ34_14420 [Halopseudomonas pachastrellae]|nr:hypothetical protein UMZ34_14420 [Halopseudomonas pachastrellae]
MPVDGIGHDAAGLQHLQRLEQAIANLNPAAGNDPDLYTWTPLAETHYEISRYLRGMSSFYEPSHPVIRALCSGAVRPMRQLC